MRKLFFLLLLSVAFWGIRCGNQALPPFVERPISGLNNTPTIHIDRVERTDSTTVLFIDAYFRPRNWIKIITGTYIVAKGEKYFIAGSEGIELDELHWMPESGEDHFKLIFPAIPADTRTIDFIESDCDDCFKIWDIDLTGNPKPYRPEIPKELLKHKTDFQASLPEPEMRTGQTQVRLHLAGLKEGYALQPPVLYISNSIALEVQEIQGLEESPGVYLFEFEQYATTLARVNPRRPISLILSPGEKAEVWYDFTAYAKHVSRYNPEPDLPYAGFRGVFAEANYQMLEYGASMEDYDFYPQPDTAVLDLTADQYLDSKITLYKEKLDELNASGLPVIMKQLIKEQLNSNLIDNISSMSSLYEYAYMMKNNITSRQESDYIPPQLTEAHWLKLKGVELNDPRWVYSLNSLSSFGWVARSAPSNELLNEITGTTDGPLQRIRYSTPAMIKVASGEDLTPGERAELEKAGAYYVEVFDAVRAENNRKYEEALAKGGFEILPTPEVAPDKILEAIVAQNKGKAIFFDFWATWCGPCLQAMQTIKPVKPDIYAKGVEVLYISGETSPRTKWTQMLPEIGGKHYYLTNEQWRIVCDKYGIQGIPNYLIFDKNGTNTFQTAGYPGNDKILEELAKVW